jgi:HPt (histidine-containing phosphotransfer) domain-containing protein
MKSLPAQAEEGEGSAARVIPKRATVISPDAPHRPPIDFDSLVQRCMSDSQFARAMLLMFAEQAPLMVNDLRAGLTAGDAARAAKAAHTIKGSAANVSAQQLSACAAAIEDACRSGEMGTISEWMNRLNDELTRCLTYIDAQAEHRTT